MSLCAKNPVVDVQGGSRKEGSRTVQVVAPSGQSAQNRVKGKEELKARRGGLREGHSMNGDNYILEW